jgi:glutamyl-tRNA synthetase
MASDIVTRFAPSPTGYLHIGGARTALFNWLYARHHGGRMLLRIEDTDRDRSTQPAIAAIIDGLKWLGLDWDGDTVFQFARAQRHTEAALSLVASGNAYPCFAAKEELEEMREQARREGRPMRYDGRWRDRDPRFAPPGVKPVIRLRAQLDGETVVDDMVQGRVVWQNKDLDDLVLLRSDGTPTYMLAVVVDDHDMGITDIIRGDDHLTNAARQTQIYRAFGWPVPRMAHIPLIHGPDGAKLSKRHGALGVDAYRAMGYLPAALRNYLVRLGWAHGDQEVFSTKEMIEAFSLDAVGRSPARFDFAKLENLNGLYIRHTPDCELADAVERILPEVGPSHAAPSAFDGVTRARLIVAMPGLKERAKTLIELIEGAFFLYAKRPLALDAKAKALLTPAATDILMRIATILRGTQDWSVSELETAVRGFADGAGLKLAQVAQPLRAALTARTTSPGLFDVMVALGREECLARVADQLADAPP